LRYRDQKPGQKAGSHQFAQDQQDLVDQANPECQLKFASQLWLVSSPRKKSFRNWAFCNM
jgi:hypothetical protein